MRYDDEGLNVDRMIVIVALLLIGLLALANGSHTSGPMTTTDSHNITITTNTTNVCAGILINC